MPDYRVECPWCKAPLLLDSGGWAYQRSQIVLHLTGCPEKPKDLSAADFNVTADRILDAASR